MKRSLLLACLLTATPAVAAGANLLAVSVDHGVSLNLSGPASSVFIANPDIADVQVMSPTQVMIFGKRTGETSFMATDSHGHTLAQRTVDVTQDMEPLRMELNAAIPGNAIKILSVPNGIILTGSAKDSAAVADAYKIAQRYVSTGGDIINRVQISGSNQVQIRVRFAEVQRNVDDVLGFNWQNIASVGNFTLGLASGAAVSAATTAGGGTIFNQNETSGLFPRPNNTTLNLPENVVGAGGQVGRFNINGMINALAQRGLVTILAEPTLTAMSGETANFLAGGEFPIPIPQGNNTISITFKSYGVSLSFTPTILSGNRISLHVRPEVSELTQVGAIVIDQITVPALTTRKAETTVEVGSGESFAIAGLMDNSQAQTVNAFPVLGDLPILGPLFRSSEFQNGQTELMVVITPYIVKPSDQQLALPTDGLAPPSEADRVLRLRDNASDPAARPISGDPLATVAPAPQAAPTAIVTPAPADDAPAAVDVPAAAPVPSLPASGDPILMHPADDTDKNNGGILVE